MNLVKRCCDSLCSATCIESDNAQNATMLTYKHAVVTLSATRTTGPTLRQCRCDERLAHAHWRDNQHSKLHRIQPSAMQPVNQVRSIGSENELQKYRLSEFWLSPNVTPESRQARRSQGVSDPYGPISGLDTSCQWIWESCLPFWIYPTLAFQPCTS